MRRKLMTCVLALLVILGMTSIASAAAYSDMEGHWAEDAVSTWSEYGIFEGNQGKFNPEGVVTRAQAAQIMSRLLGLNETADISAYTDVAADAWYADAIAKCVQAGIMNGVSASSMDPDGELSREMFFVMFARALNIADEDAMDKEYTDAREISDWAVGAFNAMVNRGYVSGTSASELSPLATINRASIAAMLDKSISVYVTTDGETVDVAAEENGLVLVAADDVTVNGAVDTLVVAQGADGGKVYVEKAPTAELLLNAANAEVLVKDSDTEQVVITGKASRVILDGGKIGNVSVDAQAVGTELVVEKGTAVAAVSTDAADTKLDVSGEVESVAVSESAVNATVSGSGTVSSVTTSGNDTKVDTIGTKVEVAEGTTGVTANGEDVAGGETVTTEKPSSGGGGGGSVTPPAEKVTVSFNAGEGTGSMTSKQVNKGSNYTLPECTFEAPANHVFKAWLVNGEEKQPGDRFAVTADITITALWEELPQYKLYGITPNGNEVWLGDIDRELLETFSGENTIVTVQTPEGNIVLTVEKGLNRIDVIATETTEGKPAWNWLKSRFTYVEGTEGGNTFAGISQVKFANNQATMTLATGAMVRYNGVEVTMQADTQVQVNFNDDESYVVFQIYNKRNEGWSVLKPLLMDAITLFDGTSHTIVVSDIPAE